MTRHVGTLADRFLALMLPRTTASAVCQPLCSNVPMCCRFTNTRFKWRTCNSQCQCWWGTEC
ncbi:hypothetical protein V1634_27740 [Plantactinospora veratri]|uniref:Uncharacterized protein n=1 Tax=Plantactinospora veratri TaxID=1436122 RepID=A0ABU7SL28_9ACTN